VPTLCRLSLACAVLSVDWSTKPAPAGNISNKNGRYHAEPWTSRILDGRSLPEVTLSQVSDISHDTANDHER
jgi:hypothetical protein